MKNYMKILAKYHADLDPHPGCNGDPEVYDNIIWSGTPIPKSELDALDLSLQKEDRLAEIDARSEELIKEGFTYNSTVFSMSEHAQLNWIGLNHADVKAYITYPYRISTRDDNAYYLQSAGDMTSFFMTGVGAKSAILHGGSELKDLIKAATTQAELDAVADNR